jgi:hypothetical protein
MPRLVTITRAMAEIAAKFMDDYVFQHFPPARNQVPVDEYDVALRAAVPSH